MKRAGIEGIYLGGWATSAKGSVQEDPGPDLASYPLSQVPDEAAGLVRALLTADRNQTFARARMTDAERAATPEIDFRPFIIADADTGHGGDAHVRNLVRRFVEAGVPGYHIEDQKPGLKKCGHQGGKVLVSSDEQIKRLSAARFQLDIMGVEGIIVARTDAEAANLLDNGRDERDQAFILGVTQPRRAELQGRLRRTRAEDAQRRPRRPAWPHAVRDARGPARRSRRVARSRRGLATEADKAAEDWLASPTGTVEDALDTAADAFIATWEEQAGLTTLDKAIADQITFRAEEGTEGITADEWAAFAKGASWYEMRAQGPRDGRRRHLGSRVGADARGLLPGPGRHSLRRRQVARGRPVRRHHLDGDQDREPRRGAGVRRADARGLPRTDARLQPLAVVQLGHHRA